MADLLSLPPTFMDYTVQYGALNPLPIPMSQITGYQSFVNNAVMDALFITSSADVVVGISGSNAPGSGASGPGPEISDLPAGDYFVIAGADMATAFGSQCTLTVSPATLITLGGGLTIQSTAKATAWTNSTDGTNLTSTLAVGMNGGSSNEAYEVVNAWMIALKFAGS